MIDNQRFRDAVVYLKNKRYIRNQQDFTERIGSDKATISQIMNDRINIPNNMFASIEASFPFIDSEWIRTGEGSMLKERAVIQAGIHTQNANGSGTITQTVNESSLINEISEMRKLVQEQVKNNQDQFNRFMTIIESLTIKK